KARGGSCPPSPSLRAPLAHDIVAISQWLNAFKAFVLKHKLTWPVFTNIATDFSYAQMNALCIIGWNGVEEWFKIFSVILLSPYGTGHTKNAISAMRAKCNNKYQLPNELNNKGDDHSEEINKFLCESITTLWTPIMNNKVSNGIEIRQSNATVESWFKTVKQDILEGDRRFKCGRFLRLIRQRVTNVHKQMKYNIRKGKCTRVLDFDTKSKQSTTKKKRKRKISELSSLNHLDETKSWGKNKNNTNISNPSSTVLSQHCQCDNETGFTVDEPMNNDMVVHDLSKPLDDCLIKSVSTPGSYKSPFRRSAPAMNLHQNMLPTDLGYYKLIKMPKNKDFLVVKYSNIISCVLNSNVKTDLHCSEFDSLSGTNWVSSFVIDICLLSYAKNLSLENTHFFML
ncbi:ULP PROTEASE domain-containing protein, partial [Aphis craccivora]